MPYQDDRDRCIPLLDPQRNAYLRPDSRPVHRPTSVAPTELLRPLAPKVLSAMNAAFDETRRSLESVLGKPYYSRDGFILYSGDSLQFLRLLSQSRFRVHLTVTSPPYNIGKEYETRQNLDDYLSWCEEWISLIRKVTVPTGALWLNLGYLEVPGKGQCVPIPYLLWDRTPFHLVQEVVWWYGAGVATRKRFCPRNEKWLFYVCNPHRYTFNLDDVRDPNVKYPNQKKNGKLRCNPLGKNPSDVWYVPKVTTGRNRSSRERTKHPAQFPLSLVTRIVKVSSNAGEVVLDPFSGSASAGIAAVGTGRVFVGFEIRKDYCNMSVERFETYLEERKNASAQRSLFDT